MNIFSPIQRPKRRPLPEFYVDDECDLEGMYWVYRYSFYQVFMCIQKIKLSVMF